MSMATPPAACSTWPVAVAAHAAADIEKSYTRQISRDRAGPAPNLDAPAEFHAIWPRNTDLSGNRSGRAISCILCVMGVRAGGGPCKEFVTQNQRVFQQNMKDRSSCGSFGRRQGCGSHVEAQQRMVRHCHAVVAAGVHELPSRLRAIATFIRRLPKYLAGCRRIAFRPQGAECVPQFGGNHLPDIAFVAFIWSISAHSNVAIRIAQTLLYAAALARLVVVVRRYTGSEKVALAVGFLMALSPLQVAWPRYMQTETLTLAAVIWVFAEILASFSEGRLRAVPLGLAIAAATFVRLDGIMLCVPVAITAFMLHSPIEAIRRGALSAVIVALPIAGWAARNIAVGIPAFPAPMVINNAPAPYGYIAWGNTWVSEEYQRMGWFGGSRVCATKALLSTTRLSTAPRRRSALARCLRN